MTTKFDNNDLIIEKVKADPGLLAEAVGPDADEDWALQVALRFESALNTDAMYGRWSTQAVQEKALLGDYLMNNIARYVELCAIKEEFHVINGDHQYDDDGREVDGDGIEI